MVALAEEHNGDASCRDSGRHHVRGCHVAPISNGTWGRATTVERDGQGCQWTRPLQWTRASVSARLLRDRARPGAGPG